MNTTHEETLADLRAELADRVMRIATIRAQRDALAKELSCCQHEVDRLRAHLVAIDGEEEKHGHGRSGG